MFDHIKTRINIYRFLMKFSKWYFVSAVSFILGIVSIIIEPSIRIIGWIVPILGMILGSYLFIRDTGEISQKSKDICILTADFNKLKNLKISDNYDKDYQFIDLNSHRALWSPGLNRLLATRPLPDFIMEKERFKIDKTAELIAPSAFINKKGAILFNDKKIRLKSDLSVDLFNSGESIVLQPTDYFSGLCTNEMTCRQVLLKKNPNNDVYDGLSFFSDNDIILDLQQSKCSNHIGVSTLAFTHDGFMIITAQSHEAAIFAQQLMTSGSGSLDLNDFLVSPKRFIIFGTERELREECFAAGDLEDDNNIHIRTLLVGFARNLNRGGKPEFFGVSFINAPFESLGVSKNKEAFTSFNRGIRIDRKNLLKSVRDYRIEHQNELSFHLFINFIFLENSLESDPWLFEKFFAKETEATK
jgi:hypothetical protein